MVSGDDPVALPNADVTQAVDGQFHAGTLMDPNSGTAREHIQTRIDDAARAFDRPLFVCAKKLETAGLFDFPVTPQSATFTPSTGST